jgi:hypothetical protein
MSSLLFEPAEDAYMGATGEWGVSRLWGWTLDCGPNTWDRSAENGSSSGKVVAGMMVVVPFEARGGRGISAQAA